MTATQSALLILSVMAGAYVLAQVLKLTTELSMFAAALAGALAAGEGLPVRHIAEGAFTYFDIILIFVTATIFMNLLKESGGVAFLVRGILKKFHRSKTALFILLVLLLLVPGALTGAGSVTVLIAGGMAATVLGAMGLPRPRVAAVVFLIAGLSAAAPPVSLWAMLTAAGVNMPYVGFFLPLLVPCVILSLLTIFILGAGAKPVDLQRTLSELPEAPPGMTGLRVFAPFGMFFLLVAAGRVFPFHFPILGLPLIFAVSAAAAAVLSPIRLPIFRICRDTVGQLLPLIGTLTCVGILVQIMTLTGVRGLIAISIVTLPVTIVILSLFLTLPVSEAVLMWGAAPVLGVPLALLFNTIGLNPIVALAGMSMIWPLGDALPPTAVIGRLTVTTTGMTDSYGRFLKACLIPAILIVLAGTLMVVTSKKLGFLTIF